MTNFLTDDRNLATNARDIEIQRLFCKRKSKLLRVICKNISRKSLINSDKTGRIVRWRGTTNLPLFDYPLLHGESYIDEIDALIKIYETNARKTIENRYISMNCRMYGKVYVLFSKETHFLERSIKTDVPGRLFALR